MYSSYILGIFLVLVFFLDKNIFSEFLDFLTSEFLNLQYSIYFYIMYV